jgi:hypothetical protein
MNRTNSESTRQSKGRSTAAPSHSKTLAARLKTRGSPREGTRPTRFPWKMTKDVGPVP